MPPGHTVSGHTLPGRVPPGRIHASCVARDGAGLLIIGPPGSGKSDLTLRLLGRGFSLVADDQVEITDGLARPPEALAGLLEVRGLGIVRLPYLCDVKLHVIIALTDHFSPLGQPLPERSPLPERLPRPERHDTIGLPIVHLRAADASAPDKVALALDCALGLVTQHAGAFTA